MTHLSLFTGIGGLDLAAEAAGFETVGQCEYADYPTRVLEKHWPDVPRWRDIRTLTKESFHERTGLRTVDVISGGFPCQPFSVAGKRRGCKDDRYLWPEMLRVIEGIKPTWVIGENVAGIISMALDTVLSDLENQGYEARAFVFPACAVDAPHRRDRCAIMAYSESWRKQRKFSGRSKARRPCCSCCDVPDSDSDRSVRRNRKLQKIERTGSESADKVGGTCFYGNWKWWDAEPGVGRVAYGVPCRMDRIRCLGNAVVPQQFYPIFAAIAQIEKGTEQ